MRICLVRHGETEWNRLRRIQGREDIPLNPTGIEQARQCGEALRGIAWSNLYSSPLKRAVQTARIIGEAVNLCDIAIENDLIERNYGEASGMTKAEREARWPDGKFPGMEELDALRARAHRCVLTIAARHGDGPLLLISHGGFINSLLAELSGHAIGSGKTRLHNCSINLLDYRDGRLSIALHNLKPGEAADSLRSMR